MSSPGSRPGKGGEWVLDGKVPVFDTAKMAVEATGADCSVHLRARPASRPTRCSRPPMPASR